MDGAPHPSVTGRANEDLCHAVDGTGYNLVLGAAAPTRDERRAVQALLDYRCEALILLGPTLSRTTIGELAELLPVVVVARTLRSRAVDVVRTDDVAGTRLAVEHLAGLGHRSIVHVHGRRETGAAERRCGYCATMRDLGLHPQIRLIPGGLSEQDGEQAAAQLFADTPPTAVRRIQRPLRRRPDSRRPRPRSTHTRKAGTRRLRRQPHRQPA